MFWVYALFTPCSCVLVFGELQGCKYFCYNWMQSWYKLGFQTSITDFVKVAKYNVQHFFSLEENLRTIQALLKIVTYKNFTKSKCKIMIICQLSRYTIHFHCGSKKFFFNYLIYCSPISSFRMNIIKSALAFFSIGLLLIWVLQLGDLIILFWNCWQVTWFQLKVIYW
jgi:hypothetical protein